MSFLTRIGFIETPGQEVTRLAQAPEGSINHHLSTLPVNIPEWPQDLLIKLPWSEPRTYEKCNVVVVPFDFHNDLRPENINGEPLPRKRHGGHWDCIVVSSDHLSYPVGGYRISISGAELARGTKVSIEGAGHGC